MSDQRSDIPADSAPRRTARAAVPARSRSEPNWVRQSIAHRQLRSPSCRCSSMHAARASCFIGSAAGWARSVPRRASPRSPSRTRSPPSRLTLMVAAIAVPLNLVFGVAGAWADREAFNFPGKSLLDHADRPAVLGLARRGRASSSCSCSALRAVAGPWLEGVLGSTIIFALPGIVLATVFVTFPFIARELIPLMQDQGTADEEAAITLGASGLRTFLDRHDPEHQMGAALWGTALQCPGDGRVRGRGRRLGPHPGADQHDAAARRDHVQRVQRSPAAFADGVAARSPRAS